MVKFTAGGSGSAVFARMNEDNNFRGYDFWLQNRSFGTHIVSTWPSNALKVVSDKQLEVNKWHHVVVVYDGSSKASGVKLYLDGNLVGNKKLSKIH